MQMKKAAFTIDQCLPVSSPQAGSGAVLQSSPLWAVLTICTRWLPAEGSSAQSHLPRKPAGAVSLHVITLLRHYMPLDTQCSLHVIRYYWTRNDLYIRAVNAEFIYGYEYLGNSGRLVITPLTDRYKHLLHHTKQSGIFLILNRWTSFIKFEVCQFCSFL